MYSFLFMTEFSAKMGIVFGKCKRGGNLFSYEFSVMGFELPCGWQLTPSGSPYIRGRVAALGKKTD